MFAPASENESGTKMSKIDNQSARREIEHRVHDRKAMKKSDGTIFPCHNEAKERFLTCEILLA